MKRNYIIPNTIIESFRTAHLCQTGVGSIHGSEEFTYGGGTNTQQPF